MGAKMSNKTNEKVFFSRNLACLAGKVCILLLFAGCARLRPGTGGEARQDGAFYPPVISPTGGVSASVQYACPLENRIGYNTAEIYLENHFDKPLEFTSAVLDGVKMNVSRANALPDKLMSVSFDGVTEPLSSLGAAGKANITWSQFYPSGVVGPGETIALQINFRIPASGRRKLVLAFKEGVAPGEKLVADRMARELSVEIPRFHRSFGKSVRVRNAAKEKLITALTYSLDFSRVYVQFLSGKIPVKTLWLNNYELREMKVLRASGEAEPDMVFFSAPFKIATGKPMHLKLLFEDGDMRQAMVRAVNGVYAIAYGVPEAGRAQLGLTDTPVHLLRAAAGGDVGCEDIRNNNSKGYSAAAVIKERLLRFAGEPDKLMAIHYCTGMYPELWNIYGVLADAVYANPYRFSFGKDPLRFIEEEEACWEKARISARPRPWLWIPEAIKKGRRYVEPEEMRVLMRMALIQGCKGVKYFKYPGDDGFSNYPQMLAVIQELNEFIRAQQAILSPLALVSEDVRGDAAGRIKVYTSWSGERGILVMVRNLEYRTDKEDNQQGSEPRFKAASRLNVPVKIAVPDWCQVKTARNLITGARFACSAAGGEAVVMIPCLDADVLIWLENVKKD